MLEQLILNLYEAFNRKDVDAVLIYFNPSVEWPNGIEGGWIQGLTAVRDYWYRQWKLIDPTVTPVHFTELENGSLEVEVIQHIRDLQGHSITNKLLKHRYSFENNLVRRMDII